jgi:hypothetical protein
MNEHWDGFGYAAHGADNNWDGFGSTPVGDHD